MTGKRACFCGGILGKFCLGWVKFCVFLYGNANFWGFFLSAGEFGGVVGLRQEFWGEFFRFKKSSPPLLV